jgi:hypothetical protein
MEMQKGGAFLAGLQMRVTNFGLSIKRGAVIACADGQRCGHFGGYKVLTGLQIEDRSLIEESVWFPREIKSGPVLNEFQAVLSGESVNEG